MRDLKNSMHTAIAWGVPDRESTGYSASEFTSLLSVALTRIEYLESALRENNIPFTETDYRRKSMLDL
jgi:hypothetical protein